MKQVFVQEKDLFSDRSLGLLISKYCKNENIKFVIDNGYQEEEVATVKKGSRSRTKELPIIEKVAKYSELFYKSNKYPIPKSLKEMDIILKNTRNYDALYFHTNWSPNEIVSFNVNKEEDFHIIDTSPEGKKVKCSGTIELLMKYTHEVLGIEVSTETIQNNEVFYDSEKYNNPEGFKRSLQFVR